MCGRRVLRVGFVCLPVRSAGDTYLLVPTRVLPLSGFFFLRRRVWWACSGHAGDACQRTRCFNDCSGHGTCVSMRMFAGTGTSWGADRSFVTCAPRVRRQSCGRPVQLTRRDSHFAAGDTARLLAAQTRLATQTLCAVWERRPQRAVKILVAGGDGVGGGGGSGGGCGGGGLCATVILSAVRWWGGVPLRILSFCCAPGNTFVFVVFFPQ